LPSLIARERFTKHLDRLSRVTLAVFTCYYLVAHWQTGLGYLGSSCVSTSLELSEKEGTISFGIPINVATAAMEEIYKRLCWICITVNTLVYDHVSNTYHLSDLKELSEGRIPYPEQFTCKPDYEQKSLPSGNGDHWDNWDKSG
jgi:hypothetical protein